MRTTNTLVAAMAAAAACFSGCGGGGSGAAASLGAACDTSQDCPSGITCNTDTTDYIANKQCTTSCTTDATCHSMFGADSHCIGAGICVRECNTNADCPDLSICNGYGWCDRTGPGSGNPYCGGTPDRCSSQPDEYSCDDEYGCTFSGGCSGLSTSCYALYDSTSCDFQDGCYWDDYSSSCSGTATYCSTYSSSGLCALQSGCSWDGSCIGSGETCSDFAVSDCTFQPGCQVMY